MLNNIYLLELNLALFAAYDGGPNNSYGIQLNTNTTGQQSLSVEMKTYYSDYLIDLAEPELIHDQFGQKHPIPKNGGKTIEFRQYQTLPELTTALVEGVTPDGQSLSVSNLEATIAQYGGYVTISDILQLTAIDNNVVQATKLIGSQAGRSLDTITREIINAGTNVQYAEGQVASRAALYYTSASDNCNLTADAIRKAVRTLEKQSAPKINGKYVGIIHPDVKYDLMADTKWRNPHEYQDTTNIYDNEIGELYGVRFVESPRAKVWEGADLASDSRTLLINHANGYSGAITSVAFDGGTVAQNALVGRMISINGVTAKITANTASSLTFASTNFGSIADNAVIYPGEGGAAGVTVYSTLIIADDAYGVTEVTGGGLQHIVKQLGSAGTADPLDQRATVGWKATKVAEILVQQYMVRIETTASM